MQLKFLKYLILTLCLFPVIGSAGKQATFGYMILGVVQDPICPSANSAHESNTNVALAFIKNKGEWVAAKPEILPDFISSGLDWSLLYHGGLVQQFKSGGVNQKEVNNRKSPLYEIKLDNKLKIKKIPIQNGTYYGWCGPRNYLPMAAVINGWGGTEHGWSYFTPNDDVKKLVYPVFKQNIGTIYQCIPATNNQAKPFDYQPEDLKIYQSYRSNDGRAIISAKVDPAKTKCSTQDHSDTGFQWFLFDKSMQYLGGPLELIDFGDYDSSGNEQFLFWHTAYNEDGYVLYYNNFQKLVKYFWSYD